MNGLPPLAPTTLALTWIAPVAGIALGASILAPLVALWFLKLRRKRRTVPSTLLWTRSLADLRANAPFQRIRFSWLLLLQILAVVAIAIALAQPEADGLGSTGGRHVLLIDRSASMNALESVDGDGKPLETKTARLELAKEAAKRRVRELLGGGWFTTTASDVMVVSFGTRAEILAPFTDSIETLERAIDGIEPTDEATVFAEALELARAFTSNVNRNDARGEINEITEGPPTLEIYSDGRISDLGSLGLGGGDEVLYHRVGTTPDNAAVVAVSAERAPDAPDRIQVFASVANPGREPIRRTLQLAVNGTVRAVTPEPIEIPAATEREGAFVLGRSQVVFRPIEQPENAAVEVAVVEDDALRDDDAALVVVPPARRLSILHVGSGSFFLPLALERLPVERFRSVGAEEFASMRAEGGLVGYDVIVLDNVAVESLPSGRYLVFGAAPPVEGLSSFGVHEGVYPRIVRDEHPLFRMASFDLLYVAKMTAVQPDRRFVVLAEAAEGPLVLTFDRSDLHLVYVTFDPLDSNLPRQRAFVNFLANAIEHLGRAGDSVIGRALVPGDAIAMRLPAGSRDVEIVLPDRRTVKPSVDPEGNLSWGPADLAGLYRVEFTPPATEGAGGRETRFVAVNVSDPLECRIEPVEALDIGTASVQGIRVASATRGALWPWVLALGLLVVVLEWWYYQRQVRV